MNYLAHILLAGDNPQHQVGALVGDFVKGRMETLALTYPDEIIHGIASHRAVDQYTDHHPSFKSSRLRLSPERRRVSGIVVDVIYDYFLSVHWSSFCSMDRTLYIQRFYKALQSAPYPLPDRLQRLAPSIVENDWLGSYSRLENIGHVYDRIAQRFKRSTNLAGAMDEVILELEGLEQDFLVFFPDVQSYCETAAGSSHT